MNAQVSTSKWSWSVVFCRPSYMVPSIMTVHIEVRCIRICAVFKKSAALLDWHACDLWATMQERDRAALFTHGENPSLWHAMSYPLLLTVTPSQESCTVHTWSVSNNLVFFFSATSLNTFGHSKENTCSLLPTFSSFSPHTSFLSRCTTQLGPCGPRCMSHLAASTSHSVNTESNLQPTLQMSCVAQKLGTHLGAFLWLRLWVPWSSAFTRTLQ